MVGLSNDSPTTKSSKQTVQYDGQLCASHPISYTNNNYSFRWAEDKQQRKAIQRNCRYLWSYLLIKLSIFVIAKLDHAQLEALCDCQDEKKQDTSFQEEKGRCARKLVQQRRNNLK